MSLHLTRKSILSVVVISVSTVLFGAAAANPLVVGKLVSSFGATLAGEAVPDGGTIRTGDVLTTHKAGRALVALSAETEASLSENTSVRFGARGAHLSMQLSSGAVRAKSLGECPLIVETPEYRIEPVEHSKAVYLVAMLPDKTTIVAARRGKVSITEVTSGQNYFVEAGHFAKVSSSPSGVPVPGPADGDAHHRLHALLHSPAALTVIAVGAGTGIVLGAVELTEPGPASPSER